MAARQDRHRRIGGVVKGDPAARDAERAPARRFVRPARPTLADALGGMSKSIVNPEQVAKRLEAFTVAQVSKVSGRVGAVPVAPWPSLKGCLAILFTSRSGSTYLARELECAFNIGRVRESLNPNLVAGRPAAKIVASRREKWFSFKAGGNGVIAAEICGLFDAYLSETAFILLVRRDIVAQSVSRVKALQTLQWHSTQKAERPASYDTVKIAQSITIIANAVEKLRRYAERTGRPWRRLVYEDFQQGDFTQAMATCDSFAIPRRGVGSKIRPWPVERIGDATNLAWAARFREEVDSHTRDRIERYLADI